MKRTGITHRLPLLVATVIAAAAAAACNDRTSVDLDPPLALDVPERADATPWIAASGSFVAVAWGASGGGATDVYVAVSRDAGRVFSPPVRVNATPGEARLGGELPPRVALRSVGGSAVPEVTVLWTARGERTSIKAARSVDGGRTFEDPVTVSSNAAGDRGWPSLALDPDGRAHAIWLDHRGLASGGSRSSSHSHGGGGTHDGVAMAQRSALYYSPVGASPGGEQPITKGVCYCCKTALASEAGGVIYAAWRHVYPGNLRDMAFAVSRDGGRSFTSPVRVSEDGWVINGCPDDGPALAVQGDGRVHLVWPTVVGGDTQEGALFYASSRDGAQFTSRVRIPTLGGLKPSHPQVLADRGGRLFIAWDEGHFGRRTAVMRELRLAADGSATFGEVTMLADGAGATYPVLAETSDGLVAAWSAPDPARVEVRRIAVR